MTTSRAAKKRYLYNFLDFDGYLVIPSQLVIVINSTHFLIVGNYRSRTLYGHSWPIFLFSGYLTDLIRRSISWGTGNCFCVLPYNHRKISIPCMFVTSIRKSLLHNGLKGRRKSLTVWPHCATGVYAASEQVQQEVNSSKEVIEKGMMVSLLNMLSEGQNNICSQSFLNSTLCFPLIHLEIGDISRVRVCKHPYLKTPFYGLLRHVLLDGWLTLKLHYRFIHTQVSARNELFFTICWELSQYWLHFLNFAVPWFSIGQGVIVNKIQESMNMEKPCTWNSVSQWPVVESLIISSIVLDWRQIYYSHEHHKTEVSIQFLNSDFIPFIILLFQAQAGISICLSSNGGH